MEVMVIFRPSRTTKNEMCQAVASEERMMLMMIPLLSAKKTQLNLNPMGQKHPRERIPCYIPPWNWRIAPVLIDSWKKRLFFFGCLSGRCELLVSRGVILLFWDTKTVEHQKNELIKFMIDLEFWKRTLMAINGLSGIWYPRYPWIESIGSLYDGHFPTFGSFFPWKCYGRHTVWIPWIPWIWKETTTT